MKVCIYSLTLMMGLIPLAAPTAGPAPAGADIPDISSCCDGATGDAPCCCCAGEAAAAADAADCGCSLTPLAGPAVDAVLGTSKVQPRKRPELAGASGDVLRTLSRRHADPFSHESNLMTRLWLVADATGPPVITLNCSYLC